MRGAAFAAFVASLGVVGCATTGSPAASPPAAAAQADKAAPAKNEVVVIGRGPEPVSTGIAPEDQGTEFKVFHDRAYRCTKAKKTPQNPTGKGEICRPLQQGGSRDPDPGRVTRSQTQGGVF